MSIESGAMRVSTHSRPKAAGGHKLHPLLALLFQLTAARRRLGKPLHAGAGGNGFNSQPPEGGWFDL